MGLKKLKNDEHTKLARIVIDIDNELDQSWQIDILKSKANIPSGNIRDNLEGIAKKTRSEAEKLYRQRGKIVSRSLVLNQSFMWKIIDRDGKKEFKINREFPIIKSFQHKYLGSKKEIDHLLTMIERLLPTEAVQLEENKGNITKSIWTFEECLEHAKLALEMKEKANIPRKIAIRELMQSELFMDFKDELLKELKWATHLKE